jgi:hypothetical protein
VTAEHRDRDRDQDQDQEGGEPRAEFLPRGSKESLADSILAHVRALL